MPGWQKCANLKNLRPDFGTAAACAAALALFTVTSAFAEFVSEAWPTRAKFPAS
jgi:hypothetical protein